MIKSNLRINMKFLIPTEPDDAHAIFVKIVLEERGHDVRFLFPADQPTLLKNSVLIDNDTYQWRSTDKYDSVVENDYDVVWWRRVRKPHLPKNTLHPGDHKFVVRENTLFYESLTNNMAPKARWINNKEAASRANSKLLQLKLAVECGMIIPTTLCSNDPQDIRYFLLKHEETGVIYKSLCLGNLMDDTENSLSHPMKLSFLQLPTNKLLQLTPGIFQTEIRKKYDLRITYFGEYIVAAKLNFQDQSVNQTDWHILSGQEIHVEPYILPNSLEQQIKLFMRKMGLVFGTLDFIVSDDHEYIFIELNEQGQFFWIEEINPDFNMLEIFIHFITSKSKIFKWDPKPAEHRLDDYKQQMVNVIAQNMRRHIVK